MSSAGLMLSAGRQEGRGPASRWRGLVGAPKVGRRSRCGRRCSEGGGSAGGGSRFVPGTERRRPTTRSCTAHSRRVGASSPMPARATPARTERTLPVSTRSRRSHGSHHRSCCGHRRTHGLRPETRPSLQGTTHARRGPAGSVQQPRAVSYPVAPGCTTGAPTTHADGPVDNGTTGGTSARSGTRRRCVTERLGRVSRWFVPGGAARSGPTASRPADGRRRRDLVGPGAAPGTPRSSGTPAGSGRAGGLR